MKHSEIDCQLLLHKNFTSKEKLSGSSTNVPTDEGVTETANTCNHPFHIICECAFVKILSTIKKSTQQKNITVDEPAAATMSAKFMHADYHDDSSGGHDGNETLAEYSYSDVNSMELLYTLNRSLHQG